MPSPNDIYIFTDTLIDDVEQLGREYELAFAYAFDRRDRDRSGEKSFGSSVRTVANHTQEIAIDQERARRIVAKAATRIEKLCNGTSIRIRGTQGLPEDDPKFRRGIMGHIDTAFTDPTLYEPLEKAVIKSTDQKVLHKEAEAMRSKREYLERAERLENRARELRRLAQGAA